MNLITHKQTQVYSLVTENWTWSFSPSTCRITACALLVSRFAWRTIKQTNKQFIINNKNKTKQKNSVISYKPGHFLCFKVRWSAKPQWLQIWRWFFILMQIKLILKQSIALSLVLKVTVFGTLLEMIIRVIIRRIFRFHHHIRHL